MKLVRTLIQDLVERRLWPVALLLAVALAAVPVVVGRSGDAATDTAPLPAAPATPGDDAQKAAVTLETAVPADVHRDGARRNPFKAPAAAKPKTDTATAAPSSTAPAEAPASADQTVSSGGSSSASPSAGGSPATTTAPAATPSGTTSGTTTSKPKATTPPKADDAADTYHVSIRFGRDGGELKTIRDVARLSPLPSVTDPFFVYLGVLETTTTHEKRAVFLVSSDATPNGEGACHPTKDDCESVELAVGQTAFFDYAAPDGAVTQYELELAGIHKTTASTEAKASAAIARHSVAGAELLRDAATRNVRAAAGARAYRYLPGIGMLVRAKRRHVSARAAAAGTMIPGLALVSRKHQPGIPVWHSPDE